MSAKVNYNEINNTLKPFHKATVKSIEKNSARFIYVSRDKQAKCERCEHTFALNNSKHLDYMKCPKCKRTMQIIHSARRSRNDSNHWEVIATVLNDDMFVLRYYLVERRNGKITSSKERARLYVKPNTKQTVKYEYNFYDDCWKKSGNRFFREYFMGWQQNKLCCLNAKPRNSFFTELNKCSALSHIDIAKLWDSNFYASSICYISAHANLYEKLQKTGLSELINADLHTYSSYESIKYDKSKSSLTDMLGLNKGSLKLLKSYPTLKALKLLQNNPTINERDFNVLKYYDSYAISVISGLASKIGVTTYKLCSYMNKNGLGYTEMRNYLNELLSLKYDITDKSYSLPKDLHKELERLIEEKRNLQREYEEKKDEMLLAISEKVRCTPALKDFFNGKEDYLVIIPKCSQDFREEGKAQHNCVGSDSTRYIEKHAKGETLILFVREKGNPNASFVTMEYKNGRIVQCMLDHNQPVRENTKLYYFCDKLATRLRESKVA